MAFGEHIDGLNQASSVRLDYLGKQQQLAGTQLGVNQAQCPAPKEYGIFSALNELMDATGGIVSNANSLTACFGISCPGQDGCYPDSMVDKLRSMAALLRSANADLTRTITHINS